MMFFRKPTRPSFIDKAGCTRQFESNFHCAHMHSFFPLKKASPLTPGARVETALLGARNRYAIRLSDHQRSSTYFAGWDRQGITTTANVLKT